MIQKEYEKPSTMVTCTELDGFLCTSIKTMTFYEEVDEFVNMEEEYLTFD